MLVAGEHLAPVGCRSLVCGCELAALLGMAVLVDEEPCVAAGAGQCRVAPPSGEVVRGGDDGGGLDDASLHPVAGECVGVLEVLGCVGAG